QRARASNPRESCRNEFCSGGCLCKSSRLLTSTASVRQSSTNCVQLNATSHRGKRKSRSECGGAISASCARPLSPSSVSCRTLTRQLRTLPSVPSRIPGEKVPPNNPREGQSSKEARVASCAIDFTVAGLVQGHLVERVRFDLRREPVLARYDAVLRERNTRLIALPLAALAEITVGMI